MQKLSSLKSSTALNPPIIVIYSEPGGGKTTWAASAPNPLFIDTEKGSGFVNVARAGDLFGKDYMDSYDDVIATMKMLVKEEHDFKTLVIDSLSAMINLINDKVCDEEKVDSIGDIPYGGGYSKAKDKWLDMFKAFEALRSKKEMIIVVTAHSETEKFTDPKTLNSYNRYNLRGVNDKYLGVIKERADYILFANDDYVYQEKKAGFSSDTKVVSKGKKLFTKSQPSYLAKARGRNPVPEKIDMPLEDGFKAFMDVIKKSNKGK